MQRANYLLKHFIFNHHKGPQMKKIANHLALAGVVALSLTSYQTMAQQAAPVAATPAPAAAAPAPENTLVPKISLYSEYEYRGISQTAEKPALQFNLDYTHTSGFYLGTFVSNIKWLKEAAKAGGFSTSAQIEWDIFGGYKFEVVKDVTLDLGYLRYEYPSSGAFSPSPNTDELYAGVTFGAFNVKYSHSTSNLFGFADSKNSSFIEANWSQEVMPKLTANAQIARQTVKHNSDFSYNVYKLGATYDLGDGWAAGGYVKNTSAKEAFYTVNGKDLSKARLVAFVAKSF
jgi:uncharacterized protein (TIGR02001 family)